MEKERKFESDLQSYREQIKQHSVTICAMEDRVVKLTKKAKESSEEAEVARKQVTGEAKLFTFRSQLRPLYHFYHHHFGVLVSGWGWAY